jgi:hypothetical protein
MRYAFYRWKDIVEEEIKEEKNPGGKGRVDPVRATSTVWLSVIAAQDLIAADAGGTSDPYAVAELVDDRSGNTCRQRGKERKVKTKTIAKTLNPTWGDDGVIVWEEIIEPVDTLSVRVSIFDADTLGSDPLGQFNFPIADTPAAPRPPMEGWFTLQTTEAMKEKAKGAVHLKIRHLPRTVSSKGLAPESEGAEIQDKSPKTLWFTVLRANDLLAADKGGTSDPFITVELVNTTLGKPAKRPRKIKTKAVNKTLNPVWDEPEVVWKDIKENIEELALEITVFDADMLSNDTLGGTTVPLLTFGREAAEAPHPLSRVGKMTQDATGVVFIQGRLDDSNPVAPAPVIVESVPELPAESEVQSNEAEAEKIVSDAVAEMEGQEMPAESEPQTDDGGKKSLEISIPAGGSVPPGPLSPTSPTGGMNSAHFELHKTIMDDRNKGKLTGEEILDEMSEDLVELLQKPLHMRDKKKLGRLCEAHVALDVYAPAVELGASDFERDLDHFESISLKEPESDVPFI